MTLRPRPCSRRVLVGATVVMAAALAPAAGSAPTVEGTCRTDLTVVLFWPRGHGAIPRISLPEDRSAQVAVYRYGGSVTYRSPNLLAFAAGDGRASLKAACRRVRDHAAFPGRPSGSVTRAAVITCRTNGDTLVQVRKLAGSGARREIRLIERPDGLVLRALVTGKPAGSSVRYDPRRCRVGAPPG